MHWVYMPLILYNNNNDLIQGLATGYSISEDGLVYTIHLNPDAVFNDGTKVTAEAVRRAWEFGLQPHEQVGWGGSVRDLKYIVGADAVAAGEREDITGAVALDDETLEITLTVASTITPYRWTRRLTGVFKAEDAYRIGEDFFLNPVGTGPYRVTKAIASEIMVMEATDNYWEDAPIIRTVTNSHIADASTVLLMFENGDLDVIYSRPGLQPTVHDPSHPMNRYLVDMPYAGLGHYLRFNTARAPFEDINIRKALAHAVDFDQVVEAVYGQSATRSIAALQPDLRCWDPNNFKGYDFDPDKAKQFLAQSSYKTGASVPVLKVQSRPGSTQINLVYQAYQDAWKNQLGIDFEIVLVERGAEAPPDMNMLTGSLGAGVPDPAYFLENLMHTDQPGTLHVNDNLDAKIEAANALPLDDADRCSAYQEIDRDIMNNYYILPAIGVNYTFLVQPWVHGFETSVNNDFGTLPFIKIGNKVR
jgi:ABC-type transport system substrate-binding protein